MAIPVGTVSLVDLVNEFGWVASGSRQEPSLGAYNAGGRYIPTGWSEPSDLYTKKSFYSWADNLDNENIVDAAKLTSSSANYLGIGSMVGGVSAPTNYSDQGVLLENTTALAWLSYNATYLRANGLLDSGFTLHYELELSALNNAALADPTGANPSGRFSLGGLWAGTDRRLEFSKPIGSIAWSNLSGANPVQTYSLPSVQATHANIDLSFTKLTSGYRIDVYIDHTLWYSATDTTLVDREVAPLSLLLNGSAGLFGPFNNGIGRIRNALLIKGPVDLTLNEAHCATVGDSNLGLCLYQVLPQSGVETSI